MRWFGYPATVAIVAGGVAALTMLLQWRLTDNPRLLEAKRRAAILTARAGALPAGSPRRLAMMRLAGPVQMRTAAAAMLPLAIALGPMVMTFLWLPLRVDPTSWNAQPGTSIQASATLDSNWLHPVTVHVAPKLRLTDPSSQTPNAAADQEHARAHRGRVS